MWWARRRSEQGPGGATATVDFCEDSRDVRAEIKRLEESNRTSPSREAERRLIRLRHLAGIGLVEASPRDPHFVSPDMTSLPPGDPLPEISGSDITAGLIRAGVLRDGCLLVRGLVPREAAAGMAARIDRAFRERERHDAGKSVKEGYYEEFQPEERYGPVVGRGWIEQGGGLLAADAPTLHCEMMTLFGAARLGDLVSDYLGEPALISVHKTTLRKADPSVPGAWHQDGFFMGQVRSLNLWLSLSRCGDESPGLDLLPRRLDHYLATNTEEAALDYTISQRKVDEAASAAGTRVIRPVFEPGDALFFDEVFLHQTGSDPAMRKPRYAIENWFFGGSGFPEEYAPVAV